MSQHIPCFRLILATVFTTTLIGFCSLAWAERADIGRSAPTFNTTSLDGQPISLQGLRGRVVLIDFWASWCTPCREEFPELETLYRNLRQQGVEIVAISVDRDRENVDAFLAKHPVSFHIVHDPGKVLASQFSPRAMPTLYILDQSGVVRYVHLGFQRSYIQKYQEEIALLLNEGRSGKALRKEKIR